MKEVLDKDDLLKVWDFPGQDVVKAFYGKNFILVHTKLVYPCTACIYIVVTPYQKNVHGTYKSVAVSDEQRMLEIEGIMGQDIQAKWDEVDKIGFQEFKKLSPNSDIEELRIYEKDIKYGNTYMLELEWVNDVLECVYVSQKLPSKGFVSNSYSEPQAFRNGDKTDFVKTVDLNERDYVDLTGVQLQQWDYKRIGMVYDVDLQSAKTYPPVIHISVKSSPLVKLTDVYIEVGGRFQDIISDIKSFGKYVFESVDVKAQKILTVNGIDDDSQVSKPGGEPVEKNKEDDQALTTRHLRSVLGDSFKCKIAYYGNKYIVVRNLRTKYNGKKVKIKYIILEPGKHSFEKGYCNCESNVIDKELFSRVESVLESSSATQIDEKAEEAISRQVVKNSITVDKKNSVHTDDQALTLADLRRVIVPSFSCESIYYGNRYIIVKGFQAKYNGKTVEIKYIVVEPKAEFYKTEYAICKCYTVLPGFLDDGDEFVLESSSAIEIDAIARMATGQDKDKEPEQTEAPKKGHKEIKGKVRWDLLPYDALKEVAKVFQNGLLKYDVDNWKYVENPNITYFSAAMRHMTDDLSGATIDKDSKLHAMAHACANTLIALWHRLNEGGSMSDTEEGKKDERKDDGATTVQEIVESLEESDEDNKGEKDGK